MMEFVTYVVMERSWMNVHHVRTRYKNGVDEFFQCACQNGKPINLDILLSLRSLSELDMSGFEGDT